LLYCTKNSAVNEVVIIPYHVAVVAVDEDQDGDVNFDALHSQDAFDLNLEAADHQELQQMTSKPQ
jgi:hypothetical protein